MRAQVPGERVAQTVLEQRPVGKARQRVVEGLMAQLILECLALAEAFDRPYLLGEDCGAPHPREAPAEPHQRAHSEQQRSDRRDQRALKSPSRDSLLVLGGPLRVEIQTIQERLETPLHSRERRW